MNRITIVGMRYTLDNWLYKYFKIWRLINND